VPRRTSVASVASVAVLGAGLLGLGALPAAAVAGGGQVHPFSIPGVHGISAWGSYQHLGSRVRVTVCVRDTARDVYGGAAAAVAFDPRRHHQPASVVVIGYRNSSCHTMLTSYTAHLDADALSGYRDGKVRQAGPFVQIY
jgi:hypothetical protein